MRVCYISVLQTEDKNGLYWVISKKYAKSLSQTTG